MGIELWQTYRFRGAAVMVTQQWHDSFGRPMVRIESIDDDRSDGMLQSIFEQDAIPSTDI